MKNFMYNKTLNRLICSVMLCIMIFSYGLPVHAEWSDVLEKFKTKVCESVDKLLDDAQIAHDSIVDLYDEYVLALTQAEKDVIDTFTTQTEVFVYIVKSFTAWIKKNKLFGTVTTENPLQPTHHLEVRKNKPEGSQEPSSHTTNTHDDSDIYDVDGFVSNYPFEYGRSELSKFIWTDSCPHNFTTSIWDAQNSNGVNWIRNPNIDRQTFLQTVRINSSYYTTHLVSVVPSDNYESFIYIYGVEGNYDRYWDSYYSRPMHCYKSGDYLYLIKYSDYDNYKSYNARNREFKNGQFLPTSYGSTEGYPDKPFCSNGKNFFNYAVGNFIIFDSSTPALYVFYHGIWYDCPLEDNYSYGPDTISRIKLFNKYDSLDTSLYDNVVNKYITIINQVINDYPDIDLSDLINIVQNIDYSEELEDLQELILELQHQLEEQAQDIADIKGTMSYIKRYLKNIDANVTKIFNRIDSLFTNTGAFALADQLDRLFHHLEATINALDLSGGGSGDVNFNFGDLDLHLTSILVMNEAQAQEIASDLNTLKSPFNWIGDVVNGTKGLFGKMVARSAAYAGVGYNAEAYKPKEGDFFDFDFSVSGNSAGSGPVSTGDTTANNTGASTGSTSGSSSGSSSGTSSGSTSGSDSGVADDITEEDINDDYIPSDDGDSASEGAGFSSSPVNVFNMSGGVSDAPQVMIHFGNAQSSIDYGGDVAVIDLSWYAPYKKYVDDFIVGFCWLVFIWSLFRRIPGIISGVDGVVRDVDPSISYRNSGEIIRNKEW